ncbi:PREDICTED: serine/arginine repetitive matrix protein 1-like [Cyprinodon variegatus]|uniref:serine/arginine repetitive matrix protein 1-like n=1 Tax=Cyprinodon variegatus TaxID=28743 RepID=UPI00074277E3|nr:PREDICTED: serine/arginine repetitive matrix protein 1-like [Cyprinodon variegatus]
MLSVCCAGLHLQPRRRRHPASSRPSRPSLKRATIATAPGRTAKATPPQSSPPTPAARRLTKSHQQRKLQLRKVQKRRPNPGNQQHPKQRNQINPSGTRTRTPAPRSQQLLSKVKSEERRGRTPGPKTSTAP